jgi:hypothetical protein
MLYLPTTLLPLRVPGTSLFHAGGYLSVSVLRHSATYSNKEKKK